MTVSKRSGIGLIVVAVTLLLAIGSRPAPVAAHAFLVASEPAANAVLPDTPTRVAMTFSEPLERVASTKAALYDQFGQKVESATLQFDLQNRNMMILVLPDRLPRGTYSVLWQTLSAADGHRAQGYIPFTIGTVDDIRSVVPPEFGTSAGPPEWLQTAARWVSYAGLSIVVAIWPIWLLVLRPGISPAWQAGPGLVRRARKLAFAGVGTGIVGALLALYVQSANADDGAGVISSIGTTLTDTRYGRIWLLRVVFLLVMAVGLLAAAWWRPKAHRALTWGLAGLAALLPLPFALVAHAAAQTRGRTGAIAFDMFHLLAASLWVGGLFALFFVLIPTLRDLTPAGRRVVLSGAVPRFSAVALASWAIIILTGLYTSWLQVGSWEALRETDYGKALTVKVLLLLPLLLLAAFNLLIVSRQVKRAAEPGAATLWSRRFGFAVGSEVVLVLIVLLVAGRLTTQAPAREALAQAQNQIDITLDLQGHAAVLSLAPARTGPNHYRLSLGGDPLPADTEAVLRLTVPNLKTAESEVALQRVAGNAFETHGSELSVAGDWQVEVIVRRIGDFQWSETTVAAIQPLTISSDNGFEPIRFASGGVVGLVMIALAFTAFAYAWWTGKGSLRRESAGIGAVALALGMVLMVQARVPEPKAIDLFTPNPIPADSASIERGAAAYQANCIACHGVTGRGDGPNANDFVPAAADFTTAHAKAHLDAEFFNWIKNGKPPTAMPAWGDRLSDDQIWDVVNYLREIQRTSEVPAASSVASPVASPLPGD